MKPLKKHIEEDFGDNQTAAAKHYGVSRQTIRIWINRGVIIIDARLYEPVRAAKGAYDEKVPT